VITNLENIFLQSRYEGLDTSLVCQTLSFQHTPISDHKKSSISFQMLPDSLSIRSIDILLEFKINRQSVELRDWTDTHTLIFQPVTTYSHLNGKHIQLEPPTLYINNIASLNEYCQINTHRPGIVRALVPDHRVSG